MNTADKKAREALLAHYQSRQGAATDALGSLVGAISDADANRAASMISTWMGEAASALADLAAAAEGLRTFDWLHRNDD